MDNRAAPFDLRVRPELAAGGFSRDDGTLAFYQRVDSLLRPGWLVLDFGAGRGAQFDNEGYASRYKKIRGRVAKLIGVDVDPIVMNNSSLDEAHVIKPDQQLPFAGATFDLIISDWVLEHVENPEFFACEIHRLLKVGGWFCARTPNRWGYIALAARLVPEKFHGHVLGDARPDRKEQDVFPKFYRLNTLYAVRKYFPSIRFLNASYTHNPDPSYHGGRLWVYRLIELFQSLPIKQLNTTIMIFLKKQA